MTAAPDSRPEPPEQPFAGASPAQVRAALTPEDVARFDRQWHAAMRVATDTLDLTAVHELLDSWRRVAWLTAARGPDGYRRILDRAAEAMSTGAEPAGSVPLEEVRLLIAERLA
jgi:hypothetical protein